MSKTDSICLLVGFLALIVSNVTCYIKRTDADIATAQITECACMVKE